MSDGWLDTSGDDETRLTAYAGNLPEDQPGGETYDKNSYHGIGDHSNKLSATPEHQSVALTPKERLARFGVIGKSTGRPFTYNGQTYYDDDTAAQYYKGRDQGRVVDVYQGGSGGAMDEHDTPDETKISELPEHLDLENWDQPHNISGPAPQETVEAPPVAKRSLIQEFHDKYPNETGSDQGILAQMHALYAPTMPEEEFKVAATSPDGRDIIKDWQERTKTPLEQIRDQHPEWSNYSNDQLIKTLYSEWTKNKQIDAGKMSLTEFRYRMQPPTDFANQYARLVDQAKHEFLPKTASVGAWALSGLEQQALDQAEPTIREILAKTYSPDVNLDDLIKTYSKMTPQERTKEFAEANAQFMRDDDSARLLDQLNASFEVIGKAAEYQKSIGWMKKALVTLDAPGPNQLPPNQEQLVDTIVKLPAQAGMAMIPGVREFGLWGTIYGQTKAAIEQNNPGMSQAEVNSRAENATMQAFPLNELLQLSFLRGTPEIVGTIANRLKTIGFELGKEVVFGAGVGGANQVITNIAAGRDPLFGVGQSAGTMATLGLAGRGLGLTVEGLTRAQTQVPEIRRATGISADIVGATPEEANKIVNGDPNAEVNLKATRNSIDLILSAHANREAEKGNVPAWQIAREAEIAAKAEKTPASEAFDKAKTARNNGDLKTAQEQVDKASSLLNGDDKKKNQEDVADGLKGLTKNAKTKLKNLEGYMGLDDPPGKKAKRGEQGAAFNIFGGRRKITPKEEAETQPPGVDPLAETEGEEAEAFSGGNPLPFVRKAAQTLGSNDAVKKWVDPIARTIAPEHRGPGGAETVAIVKPRTSRVKNVIQQGIQIIADDMDMGKFFREGYRSDRRDAFWGKFSNEQIAAWQSLREQGKSTGNELVDKMFDFDRAVYDWLDELGRKNGIEFGHLKDYFHHSFKNTEGEVSEVFKDWEPKFGKQAFQKTRHYPTLDDALAAGLIPKSYSPERNLMSYAAAMTTAIRQVQILKEMSQFNLALPIEDVKAQGLTKQKGWSLYTAADGNSYYVRDDAAGVLANAFDLHSIYDTMAGPFVMFARAMKAATGLKLSWSVFHPLHIASNAWIEVLSTSMHRAVLGVATGQDFNNALYATITMGIGPMVSAYRENAALLEALLTGKGLENLSDLKKRDYVDLLDMALNPSMGDDRRAALADMLFRGWNGAQKARDIAEFGYKFITAEPWNAFFFGKLVPTLKIMSALARRDTILLKKGEAYRSPENMQWKLDLSEINKDVENRFGEMCYDNLFWNRMAKQIGTAVPLSLGWNLGFWRMYGGGVVDMLDNVAHIDQITKYVTSGGKEGRPLNVTNRLLYMVNYTLGTMATSGLITYLMTQTMPSGMDFFFPRIGKKANGDDERVRTPFWTGEWASMWEHFQENRAKNLPDPIAGAYALTDYFGNKANPGLASIWHFINNRTFMGRDIYDMRDPWNKQLMDVLGAVLKDALPISMQDLEISGRGIRAVDPKGIPLDPKQVIMSFLGFTQAPTYSTRTGLQNKIITMFHTQMNMHMGKRESDIFDAKTRYQYAIQAGDQAMQAEELSNLRQLGAGSRLVEDARKNANVPPAHRAYKGLTWENQSYLLKHMSPSEYHEYWPITKPDAKMDYIKTE